MCYGLKSYGAKCRKFSLVSITGCFKFSENPINISSVNKKVRSRSHAQKTHSSTVAKHNFSTHSYGMQKMSLHFYPKG